MNNIFQFATAKVLVKILKSEHMKLPWQRMRKQR